MSKKIPKYIQFINLINEKLENNDLKPGDKLLSENQLSSKLSMSRQTIRHGMSILEQEGIVKRIQGSGTYICNNNSTRKKTMTVAVVTTYVDRYIFPKIIKEIEKIISNAGYSTQIAFTDNTLEKEYNILNNLLENNSIDGLIIEPSKSAFPNPNTGLYGELKKRGIPIVFINSYYVNLDLPHVSMNDKEAGLLASNKLIESGHKRIAGIFKSDDRQGQFRYAGYLKGLKDAGLRIHDKNVIWLDTEDINNIEYNEVRILNRIKGCTGCVCYNDEVAVRLVEICKRNNIKIPEDLSIISFDDSYLATHCEVPLTSISYPVNRLARIAAQNLLKLIDDNNFDANCEISPTITIRNSVKRL